MSISVDPHVILTGRITNVVLRSSHETWTPGSPGKPSFTLSGGAVGDTITDQVILSPHTAVISIKSTLANAILTITDSVNKEAASVAILGAVQLAAIGQTPVDNNSKVTDGKHNQSGR